MHDIQLILTITGGLAAALVFGYIAKRLRLPPMVGYLLAGVAVGPYTPGFNADHHLAQQLAEVGIILLMFGVGLHFHLKQLLDVKSVAIPGAVGQSLIATIGGAVVAHYFGWDWAAGIVFGLAISVASTVVLVRVLTDNRDLHTTTGRIAVGWLVVEDLFTVVVLVLLPTIFGGERVDAASIAYSVVIAAVKISVLVAFTFIVGGRIIPWLFEQAAASRSRELFTLTVIVTALGIAVGSATIFGVSMALGAFLAGMVVGRSDFSLRAASEALPMQDVFAVLFFVSVGMLFDPQHLLKFPLQIVATLAIVLLMKPAAALVIVLTLGRPLRVALAVSVALAQIGEFSFILAALGRELKILPDEATSTLVAAAMISISVNPLLYRLVDPFDAWVTRHPQLSRFFAPTASAAADRDDGEQDDPRAQAVIIGYGPVGRTVTRLLMQHEIDPTVIELNLNAIRLLQSMQISAVYGDAARRDVLKAAGVREAGILIISSSGLHGGEEVIRLARELNPKIRVLARADYIQEIATLRQAGAEVVFSSEGEIALSLTEVVLRGLGATSAEIAAERERVRGELLDPPPIVPRVLPSTPADDDPVSAGDGENGETAGEEASESTAKPPSS